MPPLDKQLRKALEDAVTEARIVAETAAREAILELGVAGDAPFPHLSESQRELRRRLQAHAQRLGDTLKGDNGIDLLVEETAYQHWHRMLFARFLAENHLLLYPDPTGSIPVTIAECEDLAPEEGAQNGWELAARFASQMLPQIFRPDVAVLTMRLPINRQQQLEKILDEMPDEVFTATDSIGWAYQYWQSKRKNDVNKLEIKIGARELPAVTQIFTESYMVNFLLDNTVGAWWAGTHLNAEDLNSAKSEEELRYKIALPDCQFSYLRFIRNEAGTWKPAAGFFENWPKLISDLKILDPCCGSGHFLVALLNMLVPLRMAEEKISAKEAIDAILQHNIYGLEIEQRCVELAVFSLALAAWSFPGSCGYHILPKLNVANSGQVITTNRDSWINLAQSQTRLRNALYESYEVFQHASILGSLIKPKKDLFMSDQDVEHLEKLIIEILSNEKKEPDDFAKLENSVVAADIGKALQILSKKYHLVATNVPYLSRSKQNDFMRNYFDIEYDDSKSDLATVCLSRCLNLNCSDGATCVVMPQGWLYLTSYKRFRINILKNKKFNFIAKLGAHAFQTPMWDFNIQLLIISNSIPKIEHMFVADEFSNDSSKIALIDVSEFNNLSEKIDSLKKTPVSAILQNQQLKAPDARIGFTEASGPLLMKYAKPIQGIKTGDDLKHKRFFWEIIFSNKQIWNYLMGSVSRSFHFMGMNYAINWENKGLDFARLQGYSA